MPDVGTWASAPTFAAIEDTLWVLYHSGDDSDGPDGGRADLWFRKGVKMADAQVTPGQTRNWGPGYIYLDRDFLVASGGTLNIAPGTVVVAAATDAANVGLQPTKVELVVRGTLHANGDVDNLVQLRSVTGEEGAWGGILFDVSACQRIPSGEAVSDQPISSIRNATIADAVAGVSIENLSAPLLENVSFANVSGDRHIYLNGSDVTLPAGYWSSGSCASPGTFADSPATWALTPGTHVVAKNGAPGAGKDAWVGNLGKVDLIAFAPVTAQGALGDPVFFHPETPSNSTAAEWGGIYVSSFANPSQLSYVDVAYAANPLFIYYPDLLTAVRHSRIHHFADTGLWIKGAMGQGGIVDSCVIERGANLDPALGKTGVFLDGADHVTFANNRVEMTGSNPSIFNARGLDIYFGKTYCQTQPAGPDTVLVAWNVFVGPGRSVSEQLSTFTGVHSDWVCGHTGQKVEFSKNIIYDWNTAGFNFSQCSDIDVKCNRVELNRRAVEFFRNTEPTGPGVRFRLNLLSTPSAAPFGARTQKANKTEFGPSTSDKGDNELRTQTNIAFIVENEPGNIHTPMPAGNNWWYIGSVLKESESQINVSPYIITELPNQLDAPRVTVNPPHSSHDPWPDPPCYPNSDPPSGTVLGGPGLAVIDEERGDAANESVREESLPEQSELGMPRPNPTHDGFSVSLSVGWLQGGLHDVTVFDVSGRRVRTLVRGAVEPGRYALSWDGRDERGGRVASGIYFLRCSGPALRTMRKVVLLG